MIAIGPLGLFFLYRSVCSQAFLTGIELAHDQTGRAFTEVSHFAKQLICQITGP